MMRRPCASHAMVVAQWLRLLSRVFKWEHPRPGRRATPFWTCCSFEKTNDREPSWQLEGNRDRLHAGAQDYGASCCEADGNLNYRLKRGRLTIRVAATVRGSTNSAAA